MTVHVDIVRFLPDEMIVGFKVGGNLAKFRPAVVATISDARPGAVIVVTHASGAFVTAQRATAGGVLALDYNLQDGTYFAYESADRRIAKWKIVVAGSVATVSSLSAPPADAEFYVIEEELVGP